MDNRTAAYIASNPKEIYSRNTMIDPGSGTAGFGEYNDFYGTYFVKPGIGSYVKKLQLFCLVKDWKKFPLQEDIWHSIISVITRSEAWTAKYTPTLPEFHNIRSLQEKISDSPFDSSTSEEHFLREDLSRIIQIIFEAGKNEQFEDGMKSDFSVAIENIIKNYQDHAIEMLSEFLTSNKIDSDLLCETLRTLGNLQDDETEQIRFQILIPYLSHTSPFIRDCTGLALYDLESPNAIPYIRKAIDKELYQSLKMDFKKIINELQEIKSAQVDPTT